MSTVVWSVNILIAIGLIGVIWVLYYVLTLDKNEEQSNSNTNTSEVDH
jgi:uncharacterized ion transporter superfamily protein YfcC